MTYLAQRKLQPRIVMSGDSGTWQFRLPRSGLINALTMFVEITNGATSCKDEDVYDAIDRIEIIGNGSTVLYSLTGQQARCWSHAHLKRRPNYVRDENAAVVQAAHIHIPFGSGMYDFNHYLDCSRFTDLELRLTYSPTIAATSFATGTIYVTLYADMWFAGVPGPYQGMYRCTEVLYHTSAASGDKELDLPLGFPHLAYGIYVYEAGVNPHANITNVEVRVNDGESIPIEGRFEDLSFKYAAALGIDTLERGAVLKSDTDTIETRTGTVATYALETEQTLTIGTTDEAIVFPASIAGGRITIADVLHDAAQTAADSANTTDHMIRWTATARYGIGNFLLLPFGYPNNAELALPANTLSRVRLTLTQGNAGAEVRVSLLELYAK